MVNNTTNTSELIKNVANFCLVAGVVNLLFKVTEQKVRNSYLEAENAMLKVQYTASLAKNNLLTEELNK